MFIFGYGSLVDIDHLKKYLHKDTFNEGELYICKLKGFKRVWNVAMDNCKDLPGYKYYTEENQGVENRPNYFVSFLNIEKDSNHEIFGVLFQVNDTLLELLKKRERNYILENIKDSLDIEIKEEAYTFVASDEGRKRFENGKKKRNCCNCKKIFRFR